MKKLAIVLCTALLLLSPFVTHAQTVGGTNFWRNLSGSLQPLNSSWSLTIPQLGGGGVQCIHVNNAGLVSVTGVDCGAGSGATTTIQVATTTLNGPAFIFATGTQAGLFTILASGTNAFRWVVPPANDQYFAPSTTIPTNTNQLTNGAGFITTSTNLGVLNFTTSSIAQWNNNGLYLTTSTGLTVSNFLSANISQWTNNSGYITTSTNNFGGLTNASITANSPITWSGGNVIACATCLTTSTGLGVLNFTTSSIAQWNNNGLYLTSLNGALLIANNLSDLNSSSSARTNIGYSGGNKITISSTGTIGLTTSSVSQFANDAGYLTSSISGFIDAATSTSAGKFTVTTSTTKITVTIPPAGDQYFAPSTTIPTNNNQLTNGAGYLTVAPATSTITASGTTLTGPGFTFSPSATILPYTSGTALYWALVNTGNWAGTWQGVNSSTFYLASNPSGYITTSTNNFGGSTSTGANPSVTIGLSAVNGTANTFHRSDSAPALSQAIIPIWTALHTFNGGITANSTATFNSSTVLAAFAGTGGCLSVNSTGLITTSTCASGAGSTTTIQVSTTTLNGPSFIFATGTKAGTFDIFASGTNAFKWMFPPANDQYFAPSTTIPTNTNQLTNGAGFITTSTNNFGGSTSTGANPSVNVTLSVQNGSANTFLRSDGAPALSQSIAPTWTGAHIFNGGATFNSTSTNNSSTILAGSVSSTELSALILANASGIWGAYGGSGTCTGGITTISATGAATCGSLGNVAVTAANTTAGNFTYWMTSASSTLNATSSLSFNGTSSIINTGSFTTLTLNASTSLTTNLFIPISTTSTGNFNTFNASTSKIDFLIAPSTTIATALTIPLSTSATFAKGQIQISSNSGTLEYANGGGGGMALSPTSSLSLAAVSSSFTGNDFVWIATGNYKFTDLQAVNRVSGDTCAFNFQWATSRASTTAQGASSLLTATSSVTASTGTVDIAITGSSTIRYGQTLLLVSAPLTSNECDITLSMQAQL